MAVFNAAAESRIAEGDAGNRHPGNLHPGIHPYGLVEIEVPVEGKFTDGNPRVQCHHPHKLASRKHQVLGGRSHGKGLVNSRRQGVDLQCDRIHGKGQSGNKIDIIGRQSEACRNSLRRDQHGAAGDIHA